MDATNTTLYNTFCYDMSMELLAELRINANDRFLLFCKQKFNALVTLSGSYIPEVNAQSLRR